MRARAKDERGLALVVAIMMAALMLGIGLALLSFVDQQSTQSGGERVKESALTLAEGVLNAETNILPAHWPGSSASAFATCTQTSTATSCPNPTSLLNGFTNHDFGSGGSASAWSLTIRDNGLGSYYDDQDTQAQPAYDASGPSGVPDSLVWARAQATVHGQTRTVVALVRASVVGQNFPRGVVTGGHFSTTNNGNKVIVDTGSGPGVVVRCSAGSGPSRGNSCLDYAATKGQVWPNSYTADPGVPNAMSSTEVDALRSRAKAAGTWFNTCPATLPSAPVVFVENGPCSDGANSATNPGILVIYRGTYSSLGNAVFYGIVYCVNADNLSGDVITLGGTALIRGAAVVDGPGGISAGSSQLNLVADPNVFNVVQFTASVAILANSWRELNGP
jgi:Tfp pilus assembly protein PilX